MASISSGKAQQRRIGLHFLLAGVTALAACGGGGDGPGTSTSGALTAAPTATNTQAPAPIAAPALPAPAPAETPAPAPAAGTRIVLRASAPVYEGSGAAVAVRYNGAVIGSLEVRDSSPTDYALQTPATIEGGTLDIVFSNAGDGQGTAVRALKIESVTIGSLVILAGDSLSVYDRGNGVAAFDGQDVLPGRATLTADGALRITVPTAQQLELARARPLSAAAAASSASGVYVDAAGGDDANPGTSDKPWRTLARVASAARLMPGQGIYLRCGSQWRESLALAATQLVDGAIVAGYGPECGMRKAVISGADDFSAGWTLSGNVWSRSLPAGAPKISQLFIDGEAMRTAQWPNASAAAAARVNGFTAAAASASNNSRLTLQAADINALADKDLAGATVQIRTQPWYVETRQIASAASGVAMLSRALEWTGDGGKSFVLQDKLWMLDSPGEFFHDTAANKLYLIAPTVGAPADLNLALIEGSVRDVALSLAQRKGIVLRDIAVRQARVDGAYLLNTPQVQVARIEAVDNGDVGLRIEQREALVAGAAGPSISDSLFSGNALYGVKAYDVERATIRGNRVLATGNGAQHQAGVQAGIGAGPAAQTTDNVIDGSGYLGIGFSTLSGSVVTRNTISGHCIRLTDCGAIYTWQGRANAAAPQTSTVESNRVLAAPMSLTAAAAALMANNREIVVGIYLDDMTANVAVRNNVVSGMPIGIFLHNASNNTIEGNRIWLPTMVALWASMDQTDADWMRGNVWRNNEIVPLVRAQSGAGGNGLPSFVTSQAVWFSHALDGAAALAASRNTFSGNSVLQLQDSSEAHALLREPGGERMLDALGWIALNAGEPAPLQPARFDTLRLTLGPELVAGGEFDQGIAGWLSYVNPVGIGFSLRAFAALAGCNGSCISLTAGTRGDLLGSPSFRMRAGALHVYGWSAAVLSGNAATVGRPYISRDGSPYDQMSDDRGYVGYRTRQLWGSATQRQQAFFVAKSNDAARVNLQLETLGVPVAFDTVSVREVTSYTVAPVSEWSALALAPAGEGRSVGCAELGWPAECTAIDLEGRAVALPLVLAAGTEKLLLRADSTLRR